ncbi:MAG: lipopolysaccharide transport system permease protein [Alphaproteobacteria bacterium]|nr:lipopolysaccharide transport system permease protein [Alphaproteobacteria bacterium]MEA2993013.1 lipopolysaccharide transport system permease protein [Alphaproteobacteria bacterium]
MSVTSTKVTFAHPSLTHELRRAAGDLYEGLKAHELWLTLGWHDIRQRYRRSVVGPFWLTISMAIMIAGIGYLYAGLFGQQLSSYLPYIASGIIVFSFISLLLTESTQVFISSAAAILQMRAPLSIYVYQLIWRNFLIFAHNFVIYVAVFIIFGLELKADLLLAIVGLLLIVINTAAFGILLGGLGARFRDIPPIVSSLMQLAFFMTPIFWTPDHLSSRSLFLDLNPFYYFVEIVRQPLLGHSLPSSMWTIAVGITLANVIVGMLFLARYRGRIPYWL